MTTPQEENERLQQMLEFFDSNEGKEICEKFERSIKESENEALFNNFEKELESTLRKKSINPKIQREIQTQFSIRKKYASKFQSTDLFLTVRAAQQASSFLTNRFKTNWLNDRFQDSEPIVVLDLCCGAGIDAVGFSNQFPTIAIDRDPELVAFANQNLRKSKEAHPSKAFCMDVCDWAPKAEQAKTLFDFLPQLPNDISNWIGENQLENHRVVWHLDPDRRQDGNRFTAADQFSPNTDFIDLMIQQLPTGVLKLAPATTLSTQWREAGSWFWIGHDRECKQLVGFFDSETKTKSTGTAIWNPTDDCWQTWESDSRIQSPITKKIPQSGDFLIEPHPCLYAGKLSRKLSNQFSILGNEGNYLVCSKNNWGTDSTAKTPNLKEAQFRSYQILETLPPKDKKISQYLKKERLVPTSIKKRNVSTDLYDRWNSKTVSTIPNDHKACLIIIFSVDKKIRVAICNEA